MKIFIYSLLIFFLHISNLLAQNNTLYYNTIKFSHKTDSPYTHFHWKYNLTSKQTDSLFAVKTLREWFDNVNYTHYYEYRNFAVDTKNDKIYWSSYDSLHVVDLKTRATRLFLRSYIIWGTGYYGLSINPQTQELHALISHFNWNGFECRQLEENASRCSSFFYRPRSNQTNFSYNPYGNIKIDNNRKEHYWLGYSEFLTDKRYGIALDKPLIDTTYQFIPLVTSPTAIYSFSPYINRPEAIEYLYWSKNKNIFITKDASDPFKRYTFLFKETNYTPTSIQIDALNRKIYWLENGVQNEDFWESKIYSANLDGSDIKVILTHQNIQEFHLGFENFIIDSDTEIELPDNKIVLEAYPNPFQDHLQLSYILPQATAVTLMVYDILGRPVANILSQQVQGAGQQKIEWKPQNLPNGVYFWRFSTDTGDIQSGKWVKNN